MGNYGSADVGFFLADGYNLMGDSTAFNDAKEALIEDKMVLGEAWPQFQKLGITKYTLSQKGFYDDDATRTNAALVAMSGVDKVLMFGHAGNVQGRVFVGVSGALNTKFKRIIERLGLTKAEAEYMANGIVEDGVVDHIHQVEAGANGETTAIDNAASSANGASAYLNVSALTLGGYDSFDVKIEDSADDIGYADLVTFTGVTAAPGDATSGQRGTATGTVDRYTKTTWAYSGSGSAQSATFVTGFVRNP